MVFWQKIKAPYWQRLGHNYESDEPNRKNTVLGIKIRGESSTDDEVFFCRMSQVKLPITNDQIKAKAKETAEECQFQSLFGWKGWLMQNFAIEVLQQK